MANENIKVTEQQMSNYLDAVRERKNNRNPVETSTELGEAAVAGALGAAASYLSFKLSIPEKAAHLIADNYLNGQHDAIREEDRRVKVAKNEAIAAGRASSEGFNSLDFRDPIHVRKYEVAEKITPKVGTALVAVETLGPAIGWSIYQYNTKNAEVLSFSMQQPAMHELTRKWMEAEEFKVHAREIISKVAGPGEDGLRERAIDEVEALKKESVPYGKLNALLNGAGVNQTIANVESSVPHIQVDDYKKAVDKEFYLQIQANPKLAEPYVKLWLDYKDLEYGLDNSRLFKMHSKINLIAEDIERTGLAGYQMSIIPGNAESVIHDLTQSAQQESLSR
jgi:hypothetical protein